MLGLYSDKKTLLIGRFWLIDKARIKAKQKLSEDSNKSSYKSLKKDFKGKYFKFIFDFNSGLCDIE